MNYISPILKFCVYIVKPVIQLACIYESEREILERKIERDNREDLKEFGPILWVRVSHFNSVQFSRSVVSHSLPPHGLQHARPPCPSPTPRAYSNSCPLSQ